MTKRRRRPQAHRPKISRADSIDRGWLLVACAICFGLVIVAYLPALRGPFMFDDLSAIRDNASIRRVLPLSDPLHPPSNTSVAGRPLANLTLAGDVAVGSLLGVAAPPAPGPNATLAFHLANLLLHLVCGLLLFAVARESIRVAGIAGVGPPEADVVAVVIAAIWLLHPLQTEAVNYLTQRTELLVSACYLGAMYASIRSWDAGSDRARRAWFATACAAAVLGAASKEVIVTLPLVLVLYDRAFRAESWSALWRSRGRVAFYGSTTAVIAVTLVAVGAGSRSGTAGFASGMPWYEYAYTQAWAVPRYLRLVVWPVGLIYDYGQQPIHGTTGLLGLVVVAALLAAIVFTWTQDRWRRAAFLGAAFFLLLSPSSSIIPIRTEVAAERRVYLASALVIMAIVVALFQVTRKRSARLAGGAAVAVIVVALTLTTRARSSLYANPEALWRDAATRLPNNARAHDNLAYSMLAADSTRTADAERELRTAIAVDSTYLPAWTNLADVELRTGRTAEARSLLEQVLVREPRYIDAEERLGEMLAKSGDPQRAIALLERVVATKPSDESLLSLGNLYVAAGRDDDALRVMRMGVALNPRRADAEAFVGAMLLERGQASEALPYLEQATSLGLRSRMNLGLLSLAYAQVGRPDEATRAAAAASGMPADNTTADLVLGRAMLLAQRPVEAEAFLQRAAAAAPNDPEPPTRLAILKAALGATGEAQRMLERVVARWPSYQPALQALQHLRSRQP